MNETVTAGQGTATAAEWLTTANLIIIAIGMVAAVLVILWGMRLARRSRAAMHELEADQGTVPESEAYLADETQGAPVVIPAVVTPPVSPPPPPLESSDVPVVAAAPLDASPATIAEEAPPIPDPEPELVSESDDLTRIKGLGPKLALKLGELGVTRYAHIADLTPEQASALDAQLGSFQGRMERDRWIDQARYLAKGDRDGFEAAFGKL